MRKDKYKCEACEQGLEAVIELEKKHMKKYGWYAHCVQSGDYQTPMGFNYHTHGFPETLAHRDIQIVLPVDMKICHSIATTIFNKLQNYEPSAYWDGDLEEGIIKDYPVEFMEAMESGREVLRVILPDKNGKFGDEAEPPYNKQVD